jgi:RNA binding exosome subunit
MSTTDLSNVTAEASVTITATESRDQLVDCITDIRNDAVGMATVSEAVDFAIHSTITVIETGIQVTGQSTEVVKDLSKTLAANWAETVNS